MFTPPVLEDMLQCPIMSPHNASWKPAGHVEIAPNCPRCASANTKFCYYNNYSLSQPRYFCKGCRRYWTKGGSLRNVPVGGGCRKNRRSRSARLSMSADRSSRSYYHDRNCSRSCGDDASEEREGANGSDIDMAAVFAKFLNQKDPNLVGSDETNALSNDSQISLNPSEDVVDELMELIQGGVQPDNRDHQPLDAEDNTRSIMGNPYHHDLSVNEFGLQGLLEDEDVFWYDTMPSMTSSATSFTWQELDNSFPSDDDDHTKKSTTNANIYSDNRSSFDFSSLGVFS